MDTSFRIWLAALLVVTVPAACGGPKVPETPQPPPPAPVTEAVPPAAPVSPTPEAPETVPEPLAYQPVILEPESAELLDEEGPGKLYRIGELLVCVLEGTHREMGYQHGRLLADRIRHITKEGYLQRAVFDNGYSLEYAVEQSSRMARHIPPE